MQSFQPKLILVATDFSQTADEALRYASHIAERHGARLLVIYADEFIPPLDESSFTQAHTTIEQLLTAAQEKLIAHAAATISSFVPFETRVVLDGATPAILRQAKESGADLLIMGTHGRTGFRRLVVGSVCESVLKEIEIPVLAVSSAAAVHSAHDIQKIVCGVEYTLECAEALRVSAALAPEARLVLIRADDGDNPTRTSDDLRRLSRWLPPELIDRCELKVVGASAAEDLASFAAMAGADLIAAGAPQSHALGDFLRGTATDRIVQHSECPVLVVNARAARREREALATASCACDA